MIIKGGENIYPSEIENALYKVNNIAECAVIGIPDDFLGENICAFIKPKKDKKIDRNKLLKSLSSFLADYKVPKEIIILDKKEKLSDIPKGPTKKILYRELKKYYEREKIN